MGEEVVAVRAAGEIVAAAESPEQFLAGLDRPTWFRVAGHDRSRTRAVATLLHGNEPSGLRALHGWLRSGKRPRVDVVGFVGAVETARRAPGFAYRTLPGRRDLNRCFRPPFVGREGAVAKRLLQLLDEARPEALIDLHNTTGHTPPYAVTSGIDSVRLALASLFGERCVVTDLRLGALTEVAAERMPAVTIECGLAGSEAADAVAARGLARFLELERLEGLDVSPRMHLLHHPVRVRVLPDTRVAFGEAPIPGTDLTLSADIDRHNFERVPAGATLGWLAPGRSWPLDARGADGREVSRAFFEQRAERLVARRACVPIMMTTRPEIAIADCLFYVADDESGGPAPGIHVAPGPTRTAS